MAEREKESQAANRCRGQAEKAAENFIGQTDSIIGVAEHGSGLIHETCLVKLADPAKDFILQRLNTRVFQLPELIMQNLRVLSDHVNQKQKPALNSPAPDWKMVRLIPTGEGRDFFIDPEGGCWRALKFIRGAHPLEEITSLENAREAGRALGKFHELTSDLDPGRLHDTLPGFHNIEAYLGLYDRVLSAAGNNDISEPEKYCRQIIAERRDWAPVLENEKRLGGLRLRVIHGDPKINNVMLDERTGRAVSLIDLDTVKPGLLLYDIGDCLRSCCNTGGEESVGPAGVKFDLDRCGAVLTGYMAAARNCLSEGDFTYIYDAVRLIPFELGLRFYTDYLENNAYFKVRYPAQNLDRAMVQFKLVESIEEQEDAIRALIEKFRLL